MGEAGMQEGAVGCREKPSAVCQASAARVNTATVGDAAAFDAAASAACAACAAFAFAAAAASVGAAAAACGVAEAAAAGDAGNAAAAFAAESAGGAFAAAAFAGAASAAASAAVASAAAWKRAGAASADSIATTRPTADCPLPSAPAAATERRRPSCSDELPWPRWQSGCCRHAFAEVLGRWFEAGPAGAPVPRRTSRGAGIEEKAAWALATSWWRRESAAPSGSSGPPLTLRQPETEIASGQMNSSTQQILSYVVPSPLLVLIWWLTRQKSCSEKIAAVLHCDLKKLPRVEFILFSSLVEKIWTKSCTLKITNFVLQNLWKK